MDLANRHVETQRVPQVFSADKNQRTPGNMSLLKQSYSQRSLESIRKLTFEGA